ncbi:MAG: DUF86 domain-containing protein [Deltaproteobacteria bacterium]|nr:MAG: DUF86 domain-containing protein [Deltaproteobacteria bacterium]
MADASRKAVNFALGRERSDLDKDEMLALAIIRLLEIVGEAAKGIPEDIRRNHPEIPWNQVTGTRDRLIHGYYDVDNDIVWAIVTNDLPTLITELEKIISSENDEGS